jgi:hypothetical protein
VQRGYGNARSYGGLYGVKIGGVLREFFLQAAYAALPYGRTRSVLHAVYEAVQLLRPYSGKVVAHAHVELEAVRIAERELFCNKLYGKIGLDVFFKRLRHGKLRAPFAVIPLVISQYARPVYAACKLLAVHLLHRLKLKEPCAGIVARYNVLRKLGVGSGGGAKRGLQLFAEQRKRRSVLFLIRRAYAEHCAVRLMLAEYPIDKFIERHWCHSFAHSCILRKYYSLCGF